MAWLGGGRAQSKAKCLLCCLFLGLSFLDCKPGAPAGVWAHPPFLGSPVQQQPNRALGLEPPRSAGPFRPRLFVPTKASRVDSFCTGELGVTVTPTPNLPGSATADSSSSLSPGPRPRLRLTAGKQREGAEARGQGGEGGARPPGVKSIQPRDEITTRPTPAGPGRRRRWGRRVRPQLAHNGVEGWGPVMPHACDYHAVVAIVHLWGLG